MANIKSVKNRIVNVLFWSIVTAAFIGPGTVTTAIKAGYFFGYDLLWTLVFSTLACLLLQEASARLTIHSGFNLGEAIAQHFAHKKSKKLVYLLIVGAIILGSAAYETGNILGAVSGLALIFPYPSYFLVLAIGIFAAVALSIPSIRVIAKIMGYVVFFMGLAFFITAIMYRPDIGLIFKGAFMPKIPDGAGTGLLVLGLVGTTVVPYDLFLGSGVLEKSQKISEMRFGLSVAVLLGGVISMSILVVGASMAANSGLPPIADSDFSFVFLGELLISELGQFALFIFSLGMFAAGFSSAITAPLASAITAKSLFQEKNPRKWQNQAIYFKIISFSVLFTGLFFGFLKIKPIPVIILAQALNGLILPLISIFLWGVINNSLLMGRGNVNSGFHNLLMALVVWVTLVLGFHSLYEAVLPALSWVLTALWQLLANETPNMALRDVLSKRYIISGVGIMSFFITLFLYIRVRGQQIETPKK